MNNPAPIRRKEVPLFKSDFYANNTQSRSALRRIPKAKSSIKSCFGYKYVCAFEVGYQIVALKSWYIYIYIYIYILPTFGLETGNEMLWKLLDSFTVHGLWDGLMVSMLIGPKWRKLVRMWNKLSIPCVTQVFTALKIALMQTNPGYPSVGSRTK